MADRFAQAKTRNISLKELFFTGIGIYIGEGSKTGNFTRIVNSDPRIIAFMLWWLEKYFGISESNIRIRLHIYPDNNEKKTINFWKKLLKLPDSCFHSCYIDRRTNKTKKKANILPYGTAHMSVVNNGNKEFGGLLHRKILATIDHALKSGISLVAE
ncbi:MAG: hypothetical protein NTZ38_00605 [Candidatus Taylorbacteria bacterium]|nr:hypothetical protein [Candidatus Taylorbacteria bacterium]